MSDINQFVSYVDDELHCSLPVVSHDDVCTYVVWLKNTGKSSATVSRSIASIKCLYNHLISLGQVDTNPALKISFEKAVKHIKRD